jgi:epsilon-lactone hydrolase
MSIRAEVLRLGFRVFVKRGRPLASDLHGWRRSIDFALRFVPRPPKAFDVLEVNAGGVKAEAVRWTGSERDILYLHGGGYALGSPALVRDLTWRLAKSVRARVLCIDYRLAPENPYPAALEDAVNAYRWLLASGAQPSRIVMMGDSAGGGLALAALLKLRDEGLALPAAAVVLSPWTDLALTGPSLATNLKADPLLASQDFTSFARWYLADTDPRTPHASPLFGDFAGLPPVLIQVGSDEMLLDDAVRMADKLRAAGTKVTLDIWPRMPHGWHLYARLIPEGRHAIRRIAAFSQTHAP